VKRQLTALFLSRRQKQQCSIEKSAPIIIFKFVLFTPVKEQLTFSAELFYNTNAATFKAVRCYV